MLSLVLAIVSLNYLKEKLYNSPTEIRFFLQNRISHKLYCVIIRFFINLIEIGLIAFDVEKVLPELVSTDSDGYKSIAYGKLTAVLVEAIKELQQQNDKMAQQIEALGTLQP
jgi:hypothetical protein